MNYLGYSDWYIVYTSILFNSSSIYFYIYQFSYWRNITLKITHLFSRNTKLCYSLIFSVYVFVQTLESNPPSKWLMTLLNVRTIASRNILRSSLVHLNKKERRNEWILRTYREKSPLITCCLFSIFHFRVCRKTSQWGHKVFNQSMIEVKQTYWRMMAEKWLIFQYLFSDKSWRNIIHLNFTKRECIINNYRHIVLL